MKLLCVVSSASFVVNCFGSRAYFGLNIEYVFVLFGCCCFKFLYMSVNFVSSMNGGFVLIVVVYCVYVV